MTADLPPYDRLMSTLERERKARREAEALLEAKSRDLYEANQALLDHQDKLQTLVDVRTRELHDKVAELEALRDSLKEDRDTAQAESAAKTLMFAKLSHEIRTPLNGIIGTLSLISETPERSERERLLGLAQSSSQILKGILGNVIDFAKLEQGLTELELGAFDLVQMLQDIADFHNTVTVEEISELSLVLNGTRSLNVLGDAGRIRQILENFLNNAFKYAGPYPIEISLDTQDLEGAATVKLAVNDQGQPLDASFAAKLFDPYVRQPGQNDRGVGSGAGLGLAICRELAELMGGKVWCQPTRTGNSFILEVNLPVKATSKSKTIARRTNIAKPLAAEVSGKPFVLVAEDVPTNQLILQKYLEKIGCRVELAANGAEAVSMARLSHFDLVIMDIAMPEMDGLEATRRLKAMSEYQTVPIIGVSAHTDENHRTEMLAAGMNDSLPKPIDRILFEQKVSEMLEPENREARPIPAPSFDDDVMAHFRTDLNAALEELKEGHTANNSDQINAALHKMKSLTGTFGHPLFETIRDLHDNKEAQTDSAISHLISEL